MYARAEIERLRPITSMCTRALGGSETPELMNLKLEVRDELLSLTATDLVLTIQGVVVPSQCESGVAIVDGRLFRNIINSAEGEIELSQEQKALTLSGRGFKTKLNTLDEEFFPDVTVSVSDEIKVDAETFKRAVQMTVFATSKPGATYDPILSGVQISSIGSKLIFRASDRFRYSRYHIDTTAPVFEVIIPASALESVASVAEECVYIATNKTQSKIRFRTSDYTVTSSVVAGKFPEVDHILQQQFPTQARIDKDEIQKLMKVVAAVATYGLSFLADTIQVEISNDLVRLIAKTETSSIDGKISCKTTGDDFKCQIGARFFYDFVCRLEGDLLIAVRDERSPLVITDAGDTNVLYLLLPRV